jgi:N-acetylmuramoyl-L-alanine amidase
LPLFCLMKIPLLAVCFFISAVTCSQQAFYGRTTGPLPYLEYGLGDDRLGGAKMTYLDTGVLVKVVDSVQADYKVQLSANHFAWLPKQNFRSDTTKPKPHYLSASWRVHGDEKYDYVTVSLPERLPYRIMQQINPSRIVVDIFGVTSNTNWITQLKTVKEVKNVWYEQVEDDVFRVFIELNHDQHWGHAIYYRNNSLQVRIKRQPSLKLRNLKIAIDAGHGGSNTGASGLNTKILEKDYTLMMAKQLEKQLRKKGVDVYMTRSHDTDLTMIDRTLMIRQQEPDLLISIHLNSSGNKAAKGTSTYYRHIGFRSLSQSILDRMLSLDLNNFGNIGAFNFALSGPTEYPNCLVEVAFLSNADDEKRILDEEFHEDVAEQIYKGIKDWLKEQ